MPNGECIGGLLDGSLYADPSWRIVFPVAHAEPGVLIGCDYDSIDYHVYVWASVVSRCVCPHRTIDDHWCYQGAFKGLPTE